MSEHNSFVDQIGIRFQKLSTDQTFRARWYLQIVVSKGVYMSMEISHQ